LRKTGRFYAGAGGKPNIIHPLRGSKVFTTSQKTFYK
jgi:hypothetical protein